MSKVKATQRGKLGKHKAQLNMRGSKARAFRIVKVNNAFDKMLLEQLRLGRDTDEPTGPLAGKRVASA